MWSEPTTSNRRTGIALLLVAVLLVSSVGPVLAAPRVFVASADLEQSRAVTGESVNVSFELRNTGDPGAAGIEVTVNGSVEFTNRYEVDTDEIKTVTEQITFEEPGRYRVRVDDKSAGWIRVERSLAETTDVRPEGRSMVLRGGQIPYNTLLTTEFPATNETVAVDSMTYRTRRTSFERNVEIYTNTSATPFDVPTGNATTVYGAVTVQSRSGIDDHRIRLGVNRSTVNDSAFATDAVHIYRADGERYVPLDTALNGTEDGRYVFETATNDTGTLLVGSLAPSFEVTGRSLSTSVRGAEKRIIVTANVTNTGSVAGNYTGNMGIDGTVVNDTTVGLAPGESREVTVGHRISRDGTYEVSFDDVAVATIIVDTGEDGTGGETVTETDGSTPTEDTSDGTETTTDGTDGDGATSDTADDTTSTADGADDSPTERSGEGGATAGTETDSGGGDSELSLPTGDVGLTEIVIGGSVAVIGVILVLLQRW